MKAVKVILLVFFSINLIGCNEGQIEQAIKEQFTTHLYMMNEDRTFQYCNQYQCPNYQEKAIFFSIDVDQEEMIIEFWAESKDKLQAFMRYAVSNEVRQSVFYADKFQYLNFEIGGSEYFRIEGDDITTNLDFGNFDWL